MINNLFAKFALSTAVGKTLTLYACKQEEEERLMWEGRGDGMERWRMGRDGEWRWKGGGGWGKVMTKLKEGWTPFIRSVLIGFRDDKATDPTV